MKDKISTEEQNGNCSKQLLLDSAFTHIGLFEGIGGFSLASRWMGSGTTTLACIKLNRKSIGIEKEKQYYDVAVRRATEYCH